MAKIALITGSSRGLGLTLADFLAAQGYALVVTARYEDALNEAAESLKRYGNPVTAIAGDVTDAAHRQTLIQAAAALGGLDLLVNNASGLGPSPLPGLAEHGLESLAHLYDTNVVAPLGLVQEALPLLKTKRGLVVNVSSDAATGAYPGWGGYGSSKAALELMTRTLAAEIAECSPLGLISTRATMRAGLADRVMSATNHELAEQTKLRATEDFKEGVKATAERRVANFKGR